ncbi:hypothetical protein EJ110_NYTH31681 [Nymphaea thermarum]|nr:hypothetical protein EJ110_NYTH31681 [Nymphaea thermarum]
MGKKEGRKKALTCNFSSGPQTIRDEIRGKNESHVKRLHDVNGVLRLKHLQKIALWAGGDASSPSFGAYFGYQLASSREALGIRTNDPSIISCQRCEALLQPGFNCKVRIEKNASKSNHKSKKSLFQNNSVYICQFCSHKNLKPGSLKGTPKRDSDSLGINHLGSNLESNIDAAGLAVPVESHIPEKLLANKMQEPTSGSVKSESHLLQHETDPVVETDRSEKDGADMQEMALQVSAQPFSGRMIGESSTKKRKRRKCSGDTSSVQQESSTSLLGQENTNSARRRRKSSWSSLKELSHEEQTKRERYGDLGGISIPFSL